MMNKNSTCPKCGAPMNFNKSELLFNCPYCDETVYVHTGSEPHIVVVQSNTPSAEELALKEKERNEYEAKQEKEITEYKHKREEIAAKQNGRKIGWGFTILIIFVLMKTCS